MACDYCKNHFEPRRSGRKQRFCPGGICRAAFALAAKRVGAQVLRKDGARKTRKVRVDYLRRIERETFGFCAY